MDKEIEIVILIGDDDTAASAKNRLQLLDQCLSRLMTQRLSERFGVSCWKSGAGTGSYDVMRKYPVAVNTLSEFNFGSTRDLAFGATRAPVIVTLSADVVPANNEWLHEITDPIRNDIADAVMGRDICPPGWRGFCWEKDNRFWFTSEGRRFFNAYGKISLSCTSFAITRKAWEATKFGDAPFAEDKMIQVKLFRERFRMQCAPKAVAYHAHDYLITSLFNRCRNEGIGWRYVGERYSLLHALSDLTKRELLRSWYESFLTGEIRTWSEALFPILRTAGLWVGNRFGGNVRKYDGNRTTYPTPGSCANPDSAAGQCLRL